MTDAGTRVVRAHHASAQELAEAAHLRKSHVRWRPKHLPARTWTTASITG